MEEVCGEEMIKIGKEAGKIKCRFPYNPAYITKTKKVFNMSMEKIVTNNHEVVTTEQEKKEG